MGGGGVDCGSGGVDRVRASNGKKGGTTLTEQ